MLPRTAHLVLTLALLTVVPSAALASADAFWSDQWSLHESSPGLAVETVWPSGRGAGAVVAVLDTGIDAGHPDLAGALWTNPREIPGNKRDDDGSGVIDDVHGADLMDRDGDPTAPETHGTAQAGVLAARADDGVGIAGVAPQAAIMSVRVLGKHANGRIDTVAEGVRYAIGRGARIVLVALTADRSDPSLDAALDEAAAAGAVVVAAAGNSGRDLDTTPAYPAAAPSPAVLAVGAIASNGARPAFSNYGARTIDLWAPGVDIPAPTPGRNWHTESGTSAASAHVAGTLALLASARPDLPVPRLAAALVEAAGSSRIMDPRRALDLLRATPAAAAPPPPPPPPPAIAVRSVRLDAGVQVRRKGIVDIRPRVQPGVTARLAVRLNGRPVTLRGGRARVHLRRGLHRLVIVARAPDGSQLASVERPIRVRQGCVQPRRSRASRTCSASAATSKGFSRKSARRS